MGSDSGLLAITVFTDFTVTLVDDQGRDDYPGQKDLNLLTVDTPTTPGTLGIEWNWDDTAWSGNNTGDACSLFDTDVPADGFANYSLCVTVPAFVAGLTINLFLAMIVAFYRGTYVDYWALIVCVLFGFCQCILGVLQP